MTRKASRERVAVVVPSYNYGLYIENCLECIIAQTRLPDEIIVVDDCSEDDSVDRIEQFISRHSGRRIRLLQQTRSGSPARGRNRGIRESNAELIVCLDADDMLTPDYIELCASCLEKSSASIAFTDRLSFGLQNELFVPGPFDRDRLLHFNFVTGASMFRKSAWLAAGGYRESVLGYEDWEFWIRCVIANHHGQKVAGPRHLYRRHGVGLYNIQRPFDREIRAHIVLLHPSCYRNDTIAWARHVQGRPALRRHFAADHFGHIPGFLGVAVDVNIADAAHF